MLSTVHEESDQRLLNRNKQGFSYSSVLCFLTTGSSSWSSEGCADPSSPPTAPSVGRKMENQSWKKNK